MSLAGLYLLVNIIAVVLDGLTIRPFVPAPILDDFRNIVRMFFEDGKKVSLSYNGYIICVTIDQETCFPQFKSLFVTRYHNKGKGPPLASIRTLSPNRVKVDN